MGSQDRKAIIEAPIKAILTDAGARFFIDNNTVLKKFKLTDHIQEYGFLLDRLSPASLQRMILIDYIDRIEITTSEFVSLRQEVMDICKLLTYSMLYRQYDQQVFQLILANEVVKKWNIKNPTNIIDAKTATKETFFDAMLLDREKLLASIKQSILAPLHAYISKNPKIMPDEKNIQLLLSEKFLKNIRPLTWCIMAKFQKAEGFESLVKELRVGLLEYMEKARIAEYVALNVIELATNTENSNLKRKAKILFKGEVDMNAVLFDTKVRKEVQESLKQKGEFVSISWKLGSKGISCSMQDQLQITVYNKKSEFEKVQNSTSAENNFNLKQSSLMDFYKRVSPDEANTELGLYYLSYLKETCEKVNVKMESSVNQLPGSDLIIVSLVIDL